MEPVFQYKAAAYARASKDEFNSNTIENQIELIRGYVKKIPEIHIVSVREDSGFSGIDFLRPSFGKMMNDIETGKINCVIVKDLSRLGRNYIEVGELMEEVLPRYNVRLIAVNDCYDSLNPRSDADEIIIPFKNLINEQYLRDFSVKIRSNLNVKRANGDFVAAFAPYGYKRDKNDKHQLVIDEHAAGIIREIFRLKIEGMSQQRIADRLNRCGEPSPSEYKRRKTNYVAHFQVHARALWSAVAVGRILRNPAYIGTLEQGKSTSANYKIKTRVAKSKEEWSIIKNAHEPIIHTNDFDTVNSLLGHDTRIAPYKDTVFPLSGLVYCGDCGNNMVRTKTGKCYYYICATSKTGKGCVSHCIRQPELDAVILTAIKAQISGVLDVDKCLEYLRKLPEQQYGTIKLNERISDRQAEIEICEKYRQSLYEDYKSGIIDKEDYIDFGRDYAKRIGALRQAIDNLRQEAELLLNQNTAHIWIEYFTRYRNVLELSRGLAVNLIERIEVFSSKRAAVIFRYQDKLKMAQEHINIVN